MRSVKIIYIICTFCFCSFSSAYSQKVISLNSLFTEQDAVLIPEIEGYWTVPVFDWIMSLKKTGDNFYQFIDDVETSAPKFEAVFIEIKGELFLDLRGVFPENLGNSDYRDGFLSGHSIYKIKVLNDSLIISSLNYSWFFSQVAKKKLPLKFEWISNGMLLTFSTEEFKSFLADNINKDGIFNNPDTLIVDNVQVVPEVDITPDHFATTPTISLSQQCTLKFPFKDGWLGGDGDASVPINDTTTIFILVIHMLEKRTKKADRKACEWLQTL